MKRFLIFVLCLTILVTCCSCAQEDAQSFSEMASSTNTIRIEGNYYYGRVSGEGEYSLGKSVVFFFDGDKKIQIVDAKAGFDKDKRTSYFGVYTLEDDILTIKVGDAEYVGVVADDGSSIHVGSVEFSITELEELSEKTQKAFA